MVIMPEFEIIALGIAALIMYAFAIYPIIQPFISAFTGDPVTSFMVALIPLGLLLAILASFK